MSLSGTQTLPDNERKDRRKSKNLIDRSCEEGRHNAKQAKNTQTYTAFCVFCIVVKEKQGKKGETSGRATEKKYLFHDLIGVIYSKIN